MLRSFLFVGVCAYMTLLAADARAVTINVSATADAAVSGTNQGCTLASSVWTCPSLRAGISRANAIGGANTLNLAVGTYKITVTPGTVENMNASGDFDIRSSLTINGAGASTTTISGENADRVFEIVKPLTGVGHNSATIKNVTITKGNSSAYGQVGGAIANRDMLTLQNVTLSNNLTKISATVDGQGGAIFSAGPLTITSATFTGNSVQWVPGASTTGAWGGAIYATDDVTISNSTFTDNYAMGTYDTATYIGKMYGGAIAVVGATLIVTNTQFTTNRFNSITNPAASLGQGGAIYIDGGTLSVTGGAFTSNTSGVGDGGAIRSKNTTATLSDTDFQSNKTLGLGGAIAASGSGSLTVLGTMFRTNTSTYDDGNDLRRNQLIGGAGIAVTGSLTLDIQATMFSSNSVSARSGASIQPMAAGLGIVHYTGHAKVARSSFRNNAANDSIAGGIGVDTFQTRTSDSTGTLEVVDSTFTGNTAGADGAAIASFSTMKVYLRSCTIAHNKAGTAGEAYGAGASGVTMFLENTVIAYNVDLDTNTYRDTDSYNDITSTGYNVVGVAAKTAWATALDRVGVDAMLFAAKTATSDDGPGQSIVPFDVSGPLFEAGNPAGCTDRDGDPIANDIRGTGYARSVDGDANGNARCDIGSYEVGSHPIVGFKAATFSADESAGTATITVKRIGSTTEAVAIDYATANGTATAGTDYTSTSGTLSWAAGDAADKTFTIALAADDSTVDGNKTVKLALSKSIASESDMGPATAVLTILDNDAATTLKLSAETYTVSEGTASVTVTVQRSGASSSAVSVKYKTADGTAAAGSDYTNTTGTLSWASGDTANKTFSIPITNDTSAEASETFTVTLYEPTGAALGVSSATVTISDNDTPAAVPGTIELESATFTFTEGDSSKFNVRVKRSGGSDGTVTVDYATVAGTATSPSDFEAASGTLTWANGDIGDKVLQIKVTDDAAHESTETFALKLSNATGGATLGTSTLTVTLLDNDAAGSAGTLGFSASTYSFNENGGFLTITVNRSGGSVGASTVDYSTSEGTALAVSDFGAVSGTLAWADGDVAAKTFTIGINDDTIYEGDETFGLSLSNATNSALGTSVATVTIKENDPKPVTHGKVSFDATAINVNEGAGTFVVTLHRTEGKDGALAITLKSTNGSATAPADFTTVNAAVSWADQDDSDKTVTITIVNDAAVEGDETFTLALGVESGGATIGNGPATVTIADNDSAGTIGFTSSAFVDASEIDATASVELSRSNGSSGKVTVVLDTANGTATAPGDYTAKTTTVTWEDGDTANKIVTIALVDDLIYEVDGEDFNVSLRDLTGGATFGTKTATVHIADNDPKGGYVGFTAAEVTAAESDGVVRFTLRRFGTTTYAATVRVATADGTATTPADYTALDNLLSWDAGDTTDRFVDIALVQDTLAESTEDFALQLKIATLTTGITTPSATGKITNSAPPATGTIAVGATSYDVNENAGTVTITVTRTGGSAGASTVQYATANGSATAGSDYTAKSGTLSWANGDSADKTITVAISDDTVSEGDETFTLTLSSATNSTLGTAGFDHTTITIRNDDVPGSIGFKLPNTYSVGEGGGTVTIVLQRSEGKSGAVGATVTTKNGTATAGSDYTALTQMVTWADQDNADKTVVVAILEDTSVEGGETFTLTLSAPTGGATLESTAKVDIVDNDSVGKIGFGAAAYTMSEGEGAILVTIKRTGGSAGAVSATFATADGTATSANDYTTTSTTLMWADGDFADKTVLVPFTNDLVSEADEAFTVSLSSPTGGATLDIANAQVTIKNDDPTGGYLSFVSTAETASETSGTMHFAVKRTGSTTGAISVVVATQTGTAEAGSDYVDKMQTLSWASGEAGEKSFDVVLLGDGASESDETFTVELRETSGDVALINETATGTITDSTAMPDLLGALDDLATPPTDDMASASSDDLAGADLATTTPSVDMASATADLSPSETPDLGDDGGAGKPKDKGCSTNGPLESAPLALVILGALLVVRYRRFGFGRSTAN